MIELLLVLISIISNFVFAFLLWQEQRDRALERKERDLKEIGLLNRIQAPEVELARTAPEPSPEPLYVPTDDDEAWHEYENAKRAGDLT